MRIGFAGGGTGGHVFPVQSLVKYIDLQQHAEHKLFWFGEKPSLEYTICTNLQRNIHCLTFIRVWSGKRRREKEFIAICKNVLGFFSLALGILVSIYQIIKNRIEVVFCKGGYVSLPVVIAARILRKNILLHESDTQPGLANRICAKFSSKIFTGFAGVFPGREIVVGQILDSDIVPNSQPTPSEINKTHFFISGGSQGSQSMYEALLSVLGEHGGASKTDFHIILGTKNAHMGDLFSGFTNVHVYDFVDQKKMGELLSLCDVAITRGGTTSLAEEHLFGLKKIIVPIPWTHDQLKNAQYYEKKYGDVLVRQNTTTFYTDLKKSIVENFSYKKPPYKNPSAEIERAKEIIISSFL